MIHCIVESVCLITVVWMLSLIGCSQCQDVPVGGGDWHKDRGEELLWGYEWELSWSPAVLPHNFSWRGRGDKTNYDHWFTWRLYGESVGDRMELNREMAIYYWDGSEIGGGSKGFALLKERLGSLSKGRVVLMYPDYNQKW